MAMPRDLDSTYQRIIDGIDKEYVDEYLLLIYEFLKNALISFFPGFSYTGSALKLMLFLKTKVIPHDLY